MILFADVHYIYYLCVVGEKLYLQKSITYGYKKRRT